MKSLSMALGVAALAVSPILAHEGPRFWVGNVDGTITTSTSDNDFGPSFYTPSRVFVTEFQQFFGVYTTEFPGYEVRTFGGNVNNGTTFGFNITGSALYFDEIESEFVTVQEMFGPPEPGPVPQLGISLGAQLRRTSSGPVAGFNFFTHNAAGDHSHLSYTLLGDGQNASDGPAGVYALALELTSSSLASSEPYYLLIGKDVPLSDPLFHCAAGVAHATLGPTDPPPSGDYDLDGDVDLDDCAELPDCMTGPGPTCLGEGCWAFDSDSEIDVDLKDFAAIQQDVAG